MTCIYTDRQESIQLYEIDRNNLQKHSKVWKLFREKIDTLKITLPTGKLFIHFGSEKTKVFQTRRELQEELSLESGGAWVELRGKKQMYFLDKGWIFSDIQQVEKKEFLEHEKTSTFAQKATGIALGLLGIAPLAIEIVESFPENLQSKGMALGLLALQQKNPYLALFGSSHIVEGLTPSPEFHVNTFTDNLQLNPAVTSLHDGGFVVVWQSSEQDGSSNGVFGRRYSSLGLPVGGEFQVNTYSENSQHKPNIETLSNGDFVVVWHGYAGANRNEVFGQRFDSNGTPAGQEFQVSTNSTYIKNVKIAAFPNPGGFVVIWENYFDLYFPSNNSVFGRVYDEFGMPQGPSFQVPSPPNTTQKNPALAVLPDRSFLVTWEDTSNNETEVYAMRYNTPIDPPVFLVNTYRINDQKKPQAISLTNTEFVIVWESVGQDGFAEGIFGQKYSILNEPLGTEFQINDLTMNSENEARLTPLLDGGFVAVWTSAEQDGMEADIHGKLYRNNATQVPNAEFQINSYIIDNQYSQNVITLSNGDFVVTWLSFFQDGDNAGIYAQHFNSTGVREGGEFRVNNHTGGLQYQHAIEPLKGGGFVAVWVSEYQDLDSFGIFGRCFDCFPFPTSSSNPHSSITSHSEMIPVENTSLPSFFPSRPSPSKSDSVAVSEITREPIDSSPFSATHDNKSSLTSNSSIDFPTSSPSLFPSEPSHPSITLSYETIHVLSIDGEQIGTFTVTGGTGYVDGANTNTITIEFLDGYVPTDGETIILFTVPENQVDEWRGTIVTTTGETECIEGENYSAEGNLVEQSDGTYGFLVSFETSTCGVVAGAKIAPFLSLGSQI